jgi:hypothetical protein
MLSRLQASALASIFMVFFLLGCLWAPSGDQSTSPSLEKQAIESATIDGSSAQGKNVPKIHVKDKTPSSPKDQAETRPNLYLGVRIDFLDSLQITSIRDEVLLDIEFSESLKPFDGDFFNKDEKTITKFVRNLFSLPEVISNINEYNQIRAAYGKTDNLLEKRVLIQKMKACRSQATRIVDSAIAREKAVDTNPTPTAPKGNSRPATDGAPSATPKPITFQ